MTLKQEKLWDYFILCARVLLALTLLNYGWSKLTGHQFGLSSEQMAKPVKDLGLFKLSWYLFDQEPFRSFIGISQIITALLLLYNRTLLLGAFLAIPILVNILIIDITYIKMPGFYWRLSYYLLLDGLILWHYKEKVLSALKSLSMNISPKFKYPLWAYLILPVMVIVVELLVLIPRLLTDLMVNPEQTMDGLRKLPDLFLHIIEKITHS